MQEPELVIENRGELVYLLYQAAELEHSLMCEYLYAAFSLKQHVSEGVTDWQLERISQWRSAILQVAVQEMLHLAVASNLLSAIGAAPMFGRPNFPIRSRWFPPHVRVALLPFGEQALRHFLYLERPEGMDLDDAEGFAVSAPPLRALGPDQVAPADQDYLTVGHLYRGIERGLARLVERHGSGRVFLGSPHAQATPVLFGFSELEPITDLEAAARAIETIVEQGEGARGDWRDAHYGRFLALLEDYTDMRATEPDFEPARPVVPAVVRQPHDVVEPLIRIEDPTTARVVEIFNVAYEVLLTMLARLFSRTAESDEQQKALGDAAVGLMYAVLKPLGMAITALPIGPSLPGRTAGPSFELYYPGTYLLPHQRSAWLVMSERLTDLARACRKLSEHHALPVLGRSAQRLDDLADLLTEYLG